MFVYVCVCNPMSNRLTCVLINYNCLCLFSVERRKILLFYIDFFKLKFQKLKRQMVIINAQHKMPYLQIRTLLLDQRVCDT